MRQSKSLERRRASLRRGSASDQSPTKDSNHQSNHRTLLTSTLWSCRVALRHVFISAILPAPTTQFKLPARPSGGQLSKKAVWTTLPTRNTVSHHPRRGRSGASISLPQASPAKSTSYHQRHHHFHDPCSTLTHLHNLCLKVRTFKDSEHTFQPTLFFLSTISTAEFFFPQIFTLL